MTGGFNDPDPAPYPGELDEPEFAAITDEPAGDAVIVDAEASCLKCAHFEVCAVYSGIRPMMQDWHTEDDPEAEAPIDVERLAWICEEYDPQPEP